MLVPSLAVVVWGSSLSRSDAVGLVSTVVPIGAQGEYSRRKGREM